VLLVLLMIPIALYQHLQTRDLTPGAAGGAVPGDPGSRP